MCGFAGKISAFDAILITENMAGRNAVLIDSGIRFVNRHAPELSEDFIKLIKELNDFRCDDVIDGRSGMKERKKRALGDFKRAARSEDGFFDIDKMLEILTK